MKTETPPVLTAPTEQQISDAFDSSKKRTGDKVYFSPEIKVKREMDILYIHEIRKTRVSLVAVVEVYTPAAGGDKAPMPLTVLSEVALRAIYTRLTA